ncbi:unnamed protein product, partial [Staurois parvus]
MDHFLLQCTFNIEVCKWVGGALGISFLSRLSYAEWSYGAFQNHRDFDFKTLFLVSLVVCYYTWNARCQVSIHKKVLPVEVVVHNILGEVGKIWGLEKDRWRPGALTKAWRNVRSP